MRIVNMFDAKTQLSKLVEAVESGQESEIVIARNGKSAAKLVPLSASAQAGGVRLGLAKGLGEAPDDPFVDDDLVAALMLGGVQED